MIKFNLIFLIGVVSAFLLTVQWIILQMAVKNASFEVNHQWVPQSAFKSPGAVNGNGPHSPVELLIEIQFVPL